MEKWRATSRHLLRHFSKDLFDRRMSPSFGTFNRQLSSAEAVDLVLLSFVSVATTIQRNPLFSSISSDDISHFKEILGEKNVIHDEEKLVTANMDWMRKYKGSSKLMLQPRSTEEWISLSVVAEWIDCALSGVWPLKKAALAFRKVNSIYFQSLVQSFNLCLRISEMPPHSLFIMIRLFLQALCLFASSTYCDSDKLGNYGTHLILQVSQILKYCNSRCLAVVPQGGNTGLVGGSVPVFDEVIINTSSMSKIVSFDKVSGILVCEAGCILENLVSFLDNQGFIMPLDLGAKGSCQIGGNVSTNAGGLRLFRYGSLHGNVLGLEVVLANGTVLDMLRTLRKDNTGYDLKHLFIGSEGSLGIVSKVSILTPPKLSSVNLAFLACKDYSSCQKLLLAAKRKLGEILSAFEFLDTQALDLVLKHLEGARNPLPTSMHNFYILMETTGSNESYEKEKLEAFLLHSMEGGLISDGVLAQDINQASSFWHIREGVPEALMKAGAVYKYDLSLPVEKMYDLVEEMRIRLGPAANVVGYGHLGDSNLHLNISTPQYDDAILAQIEPFVYEWTSKHHGSISAEHGLGLMKADKIFYSKSPETVSIILVGSYLLPKSLCVDIVQLMASIKRLLDPNGILNPYKVLPPFLAS
ncbi:hypothetical protein RJ640_011190 [Escallonia rubra]|uniref:D-2-hydroxyglutarate dehydrogenase n=1 Tax=Escallonia rubra TaxID=112253 RepID=A0AA88RJQ1_9ASTE|nr:hypothetical protein RJ640_011190 [Escallonia rubra]